MKHAILGAGAIGGLVGTVLASLGEDVTVVVRPEKLASYPANLTLERPVGLRLYYRTSEGGRLADRAG